MLWLFCCMNFTISRSIPSHSSWTGLKLSHAPLSRSFCMCVLTFVSFFVWFHCSGVAVTLDLRVKGIERVRGGGCCNHVTHIHSSSPFVSLYGYTQSQLLSLPQWWTVTHSDSCWDGSPSIVLFSPRGSLCVLRVWLCGLTQRLAQWQQLIPSPYPLYGTARWQRGMWDDFGTRLNQRAWNNM